jgi:hypothetical protein
MRAIGILQEKLGESLDFLHRKREAAFWRAVEGLLDGQKLWLTALGRALSGRCSDKHRIKAIDRLVGSAALQSSVPLLYAALARLLLRGIQRPVILVDWTGADPGFAVLSAKLSFRGRALSIFSRTFPKNRKCSPRAEREFLETMRAIIPPRCKPILVTDAGFLSEWFDTVQAQGWHFVGRLRGRKSLHVAQTWMALERVHTLAGRRPRDLGTTLISKKNTRAYRVVLSARPKRKGRKKLGRNGLPRRSTADRQRGAAAREPLVLVTSLADPTRVIVEAYNMRMQIEETFRDLKSHRFGWSAEDIRSKEPKRIDVLLLVAAFASVAMHIVGLAAAAKKLQYQFQANTERRRPVFSSFFLAKLVLDRNRARELPLLLLRAAFQQLRRVLAALSLDRLSRPVSAELHP